MSLTLPPPLPRMETVLGALDAEARRTAGDARNATVAAARRVLPARSGRQRRAARGRVTRTGLGYVITVAPDKRVRYPGGLSALEVARFLEGGTGVFGPSGRPIRPRRAKAFHLPGGWRSTTVQGQRAQHPYERVQTGEEARVARILADGAFAGAKAAERVLQEAL
jgi:hypothetical protein